MRIRINDEMYAVLEFLSPSGAVIRTVPLGVLEPDMDLEITGIEAEA